MKYIATSIDPGNVRHFQISLQDFYLVSTYHSSRNSEKRTADIPLLLGMGGAPKFRAPSTSIETPSLREHERACALNLGPSLERARTSFSSIPDVVNSIFPKPF